MKKLLFLLPLLLIMASCSRQRMPEWAKMTLLMPKQEIFGTYISTSQSIYIKVVIKRDSTFRYETGAAHICGIRFCNGTWKCYAPGIFMLNCDKPDAIESISTGFLNVRAYKIVVISNEEILVNGHPLCRVYDKKKE